jgi:hypothetical protein
MIRLAIAATLAGLTCIGMGYANASDVPIKAQKLTPAEKDFACLLSGSVSPWLIFDNTGSRHSDGPVTEIYGECSYKKGFYVAGYRAQSLTRSRKGNETDLMAGYRGSLGGFDYDLRAHFYRFNADGNTELNQFGGRLTISKKFDIGGGWELSPGIIADAGWITGINEEVLGGALVITANRKLVEFWGTPMLTLDAKVWGYLNTPAPNKGIPVGSISAKLDFPIPGTSCSVWPAGIVTFNDILGPNAHRTDYGIKFGTGCSF